MNRVKKFTWREWALFSIPLMMLALPYVAGVDWLGLPFKHRRDEILTRSCRVNMKSLGQALQMYAQDNDNRLPLNTRSSVITGSEWTQVLQTYIHSSSLFKDPASGIPGQPPSRSGYSDYWFNASLSGQKMKALAAPQATLAIGDGGDGQDQADARYAKSSLPAQWLTNANSPAYRHLGGANYLMADGAVHWLKPEQVTNFGGRNNAFAVK